MNKRKTTARERMRRKAKRSLLKCEILPTREERRRANMAFVEARFSTTFQQANSNA
jgi:hypothetical protein